MTRFSHTARLDLWNILVNMLSIRVPRCRKLQMTANLVWHRMLYSCTHMATVGVKGLSCCMMCACCRTTLSTGTVISCQGLRTCWTSVLAPTTSTPRSQPSSSSMLSAVFSTSSSRNWKTRNFLRWRWRKDQWNVRRRSEPRNTFWWAW